MNRIEQKLAALKEEGYTDVIVAIGAWKPGNAHLQYGGAFDAVEFLADAKNE